MATDTIREMYESEESVREHRLQTARRMSMLSIPSLFPEDGTNDTNDLPLTYDATTSRGVSKLSARIGDAVFPPNGLPMFEITPDPSKVGSVDVSSDQIALNDLSKRVYERIYASNAKSAYIDSTEKKLVGGDDLVWINDDLTLSTHSLEDFVVRRKPNHQVVWGILREWLDPESLPVEWASKVPAKDNAEDEEACYTEFSWNETTKVWDIRKEFRDAIVSAGPVKYQTFFVNSWRHIPKCHYSRSYLEEIEGDIRMVEVLAKSLKEGSLISAKLLMGVNPGGLAEIQDFEQTENGDFVAAGRDDVFPIQAAAPNQLQTIQAALANYRRDLGKAFLDASSIQRNGDRVTATEWQVMASELMGTLGPSFASVSEDIRILVRRFMAVMVDKGEFPKEILKQIEPDKFLRMRIRTGIESLQQDVEQSELADFAQLAVTVQPLQNEVDWAGWLGRYIAAKRWNPKSLIKTPEQKQAEMQQQMQAMIAQRGVDALGTIAETGAANAARQ